MLSLRASQSRNSFICGACCRKLSSSACSGRHKTAAPRVLVATHTLRIGRYLSTTSALRDESKNGSGPPKPAGFGHNLAGSRVGGFGAFGLANAANKPAAPRILLPHEELARKKAAVAQPPPDPPKAKGPPNNQRDDKQSANRSDKKKKGSGDRNRPATEAQIKSRSALADMLTSKPSSRDPQPQESSNDAQQQQQERDAQPSRSTTETKTATDTPDSSAAATSSSSASRWGTFSQKLVTTMVTPKQSPKNSAPPKFDDVMKSKRHVQEKVTASKKDKKKGDFWDELEQRKAPQQAKRVGDGWTKSDAPSKTEEVSTTTPVAKGASKEDRAPTRGSGRFADVDMEEENYSKKSKKAKKGGKGGRSRNDEDDDDNWSDERWERQQALKAEKLARKQAEEAKAKAIFLPEFISISKLAQALHQPLATFLQELEEMGFEDITQDTIMTGETAALISAEYGFDPTVDDGSVRDLRPRPPAEDPSVLPECAPVVTIMGHVDHGKTTLLDWLRKSSVAAQEHGGITQHIGAFIVKLSSGKTITFLDTPGHAAFLSMRQRGASVTNIVVLVVAADDGVMPQTLEALKHAKASKVPIIVAITKVDKEDARVDQVKASLSRHGVEIEDYGGDVQVVCVSGKTGQGMHDLEENIVTLSEVLDTRAEVDGMAEGAILESEVKQDGRAATVLVKRGTLRLGDIIVAGKTWARIRIMRNEAGVELEEAPPSTPVEILGWRELPDAGDQIIQAPNETRAKQATDYRIEMAEREESSKQQAQHEQRVREKAEADAAAEAAAKAKAAAEVRAAKAKLRGETVPDIEAEVAASTEPQVKFQNFIVKADVGGSVEAICGAMQELGNHEVRAKILRSSTGQIFEADIDHAAASNSIIVNFNNSIHPHIKGLAAQAGVKILDHTVIYHIVDDVTAALSDLLPMKVWQKVVGEADILQIFPISIKKRVTQNIAGCRVRNGSIKKSSMAKVLRKGKVIYEGPIDTLKHVKKDVQEMGKGTECGVGLADFEDFQIDDQLQTFEVIKEKRSL